MSAVELGLEPPALRGVRARLALLPLLLALGFALLGGRALQLGIEGVLRKPAPSAVALPPPHRADLTDRNGVLLATLAPTFALTAQPAAVWDEGETIAALQTVLPNLDPAALRRSLQSNRGLVFLARWLTPRQRDEVFALGLPGLGFQEEPRRFYPQTTIAAHVIGQAGADLAGNSGAELGFEPLLSAKDQERFALSLDIRVQYALEDELARAMAASNAEGAAGVVLDGRTGEVLGLASLPSFDANRPPRPDAPVRRNKAVASRYEIGSVLKPFTVAMALDAGLATPGETLSLEPLAVGGRTIIDRPPVEGPATLETVLVRSSNVGAAQLALRLGAERQLAYLKALGLAEAAPIELKDSVAPSLSAVRDFDTIATRGFGHGMSVSLLAVASAYSVFINDGERVAPTLRARGAEFAPARVRVFSSEATETVRGYLRQAVLQGTGLRANVAEVALAGKTGTAEKPDRGGYARDRNLSSFAAIFPAERPRYVILVALDEPRPAEGAATGGAVAAPAAARAATRIAPFLNVSSRAGDTPAPGGESP